MIYLIRHTQSTFNAGQSDVRDRNVPLSEDGKLQARNITFSFNILILSPMKRAVETYTYSGIKVARVIMSELFREHVCAYNNLFEYEDFIYETEDDLIDRVREAAEFLKKLDKPDINIGIITHHDFIQKFTEVTQGVGQSLGNGQFHFIQRLV